MRFSQPKTILTTLFWLLVASSAVAENRLVGETSPHLRDYIDSPVNWYPWGAEAFQKARDEKKPIMVSIGYHSCHWCHKMNKESFSNAKIARLLNEKFINIKVDREEYPDIDRIYMSYMQASQGSGGWPLNVWLTPDLVPFSVGTYFPADGTSRQPAFAKVLSHIVEQWERFPDYIDSQSRRDLSNLRANIQDVPVADANGGQSASKHRLSAYERLATEFDPQHGGFGSAPRFPNPSKLQTAYFVLRNEGADSFRASQCKKMLKLSLDKMAAGSIHDQIGGGFHRYTSDPGWAIPHFEKMLTDQALLISSYLDGYELTKDPNYLEVAIRTAEYAEKILKSPGGAYFSSQHSDSLPNPEAGEVVEGALYTWRADEFASAAGRDAEIMKYYYGVRPGGNAPIEGLSVATLPVNILRVEKTVDEVAAKFGLDPAEAASAISRGKAALLKARSLRPAPAINQQVVTAPNALMVSALARAYIVTGNSDYLDRATDVLTFIQDHCFDQTSQTLYRIFADGSPTRPGVTDDHAFTVQACLDLYDAGFNERWLRLADELQKIQNKRFFDSRNGGFYNTARSRTDIIIRLKSYKEDGAELAPNASSILNLVRLGNLLGDDAYLDKARQSIEYFRGAIDRLPTLSARYLLAETILEDAPPQIIITGKKEADDTASLLAVARENPHLSQTLAIIDLDDPASFLTERNPKLAELKATDGKATAHVCKDFSCKAPTTDPAEFRLQLRGE